MNYKLLTATLIIVLSFSCQQKKECCSKDKQESTTNKSSEESIYQINSEWKNQDGLAMQLESFKGKIIVAAMVFTYCESACPRIVADIQRIEKEFADNNKIHYLLISMDPERDTPERFTEFGKERSLGDNWTMVSSSQSATDEIANVLGVKIKKLSDGGFDHSNTIFVLDEQGIVVHTQEGLEQEPTETIKKIKELIYE